jgi:uncharacterized protein with NAD-binding domain and iron-sulfur cluster
LSAAPELIERGFGVTVYERQAIPGGKARSVKVPNTARDGREPLPGEHGFRFFPRFYRHITDTMKRTPCDNGGRSAFDNLVEAGRDMLAPFGKTPMVFPAWFPRSLADFQLMLKDMHGWEQYGLTTADLEFFGARVWQLMTSSPERVADEYERIGWWQYMEADRRSEVFRTMLVGGLTRTLVAAQPKSASTRVGGEVLTQLVFATSRPGVSDDRLLNGPTNDVWIGPWLQYLRKRGVDYQLKTKVLAIHCDKERITGITVEQEGKTSDVTADYYLAALPVERMALLITADMLAADPSLYGVQELAKDVAWMNGIQLYLSEETPLVNGHVAYLSSPWALTSVSQKQFWKGVDFSRYGDGTVSDILSVDISEWDTPGIANPTTSKTGEATFKKARECTPEEIKNDVWEQIKRSVNVDDKVILRDDHLRHWFLDQDIQWDDGVEHDAEPLLVNKVMRAQFRPNAHTAIPNLFLASDYVRTNTNLATMEAANEAARRAVNGIIDAAGTGRPYCKIWKLYQPWVLAPLRWRDARRYAQGLPWEGELPAVPRFLQGIVTAVAKALTRLRRRV